MPLEHDVRVNFFAQELKFKLGQPQHGWMLNRDGFVAFRPQVQADTQSQTEGEVTAGVLQEMAKFEGLWLVVAQQFGRNLLLCPNAAGVDLLALGCQAEIDQVAGVTQFELGFEGLRFAVRDQFQL